MKLSIAALFATITVSNAELNSCMHPSYNALRSDYHADTQCNRQAYHDYKQSLNRSMKYNELKLTGNSQVPTEKTVYCPNHVQDLQQKNGVTGFDTVWLVENTSTSPIVLSFMQDGVERAAMNSKITPPQNDPGSILMPGSFKAVYTFEGHVFHARELLPDGNLGLVLLQHRVGLLPVGKSGRLENADCDLLDEEPIVEETAEIAPEFGRTPPVVMRECNQMDVGFRNNVGCPLHGYWVRPGDENCEENFKLHLGVNPMTSDFMHSWDSPTKFEASFVGHTFVFRRADTDAEVDRITLAPTQVMDCPNLKQTTGIAVDASGVMVPVVLGDHSQLNATGSFNTTAPLPSTYNFPDARSPSF